MDALLGISYATTSAVTCKLVVSFVPYFFLQQTSSGIVYNYEQAMIVQSSQISFNGRGVNTFYLDGSSLKFGGVQAISPIFCGGIQFQVNQQSTTHAVTYTPSTAYANRYTGPDKLTTQISKIIMSYTQATTTPFTLTNTSTTTAILQNDGTFLTGSTNAPTGSVGNTNTIVSNMINNFFSDTKDMTQYNDNVGGFGTFIPITVNSLATTVLSTLQNFTLRQFGAISPYMNGAVAHYINVESTPFALNDYLLQATAMYSTNLMIYQTNSTTNAQTKQPTHNLPNPQNTGNDLAAQIQNYKYNFYVLGSKEVADWNPAINNLDYASIHVPREHHGIVEFYFPLTFLFICRGMSTAFPHYACAPQSIMLQFNFFNPLGFIDTFVAVDPKAVDPLDTDHDTRMYINRINAQKYFVSNQNNIKYVLWVNKVFYIP